MRADNTSDWLVRKVAKDLKQSIHIIEKQIQAADRTIQEQQQRLTDISVEVCGLIHCSSNDLLDLIHKSDRWFYCQPCLSCSTHSV